MTFRYETHLHTAQSSTCSRFQPNEIVEKYLALGYAGVFVTDHFLNGNTPVPKNLPWKERIQLFCEGYRAVKEAAKGTSLQVFFGWEYTYKGTDFLVYGIDEAWLLIRPEMLEWGTCEFCNKMRADGAFVVQAHPYREAHYIDHIRLYPSNVDGIETVNASRDERTNRLADFLASEYGLFKLAGSDIHSAAQTHLAGLEFETPLKGEQDFVSRMKRGEGKVFVLDTFK